MNDSERKTLSEWFASLEASFLFAAAVLVFGMLLIVLGILQWFSIPKFGTLVPDNNFRWITIVIGFICLLMAPFLFVLLRKITENEDTEKPLMQFFSINSKGTKLKFGLDHIDNVVAPYYQLEKKPLTTVDKKNAMSAILRMISLTTFPSSINNLCRISIYEVREKGRFTILAAHQIDLHRFETLESLINHKSDKPSGVAGYVVNTKETIRINDVHHPPVKYKGVYVPSPDNDIPAYKSGSILALPIFEDSAHPSSSKVLAVLSISSSRTRNFTDAHEKDMAEYCKRISILLRHFNKNITVDPISIKKFRIITISGQSGSGKTTLTTELLRYLEPLGWKTIQIGKLFREFCEARGYSVQEIERVKPEIHRQFDDWQEETMKYDANVIIEGRMSGYLAYRIQSNNIFRIFCDLPLEKRLERFARRESVSIKEAEQKVSERDSKDLEAYSVLYGLEDYRDKQYYNLYLDTTKSQDELAKIVFDELNKLENE